MKLLPNQLVKILFRNGSSVEGIVDIWADKDYVLRSLDGKSILIIQDPAQDIMAIKVMLDIIEEEKQDPQEAPKTPKPVINTPPEPVDPDDPISCLSADLRAKKLAELRIAAIAEEKRIVAEKLRAHHIEGNKEVKYGLPGFFKKPSAQ